MEVYNELKRAYNEVRNEYAVNKFNRDYDQLPEDDRDEVQDKYPMKISEAEPVDVGE